MKKAAKKILLILQIFIGGVALFYVFKIFWQSLPELKSYFYSFNWTYLGVALVLLMTSLLIKGEVWVILMKKVFNSHLSRRSSYAIYYLPQLVSYAPGGFWNILGSVKLAKKSGFSRTKTIIVLVLEFVFSLYAGFLLYVILAFQGKGFDYVVFYVFLIMVLLGLIILRPSVLNKLLKLVYFIKQTSEEINPISLKEEIAYLLGFILFWFLRGIALYYIILSLFPLKPEYLLSIVAFSTAAWLVAYLFPLAAGGGLGIMELLLFSFLQNFLPISVASVVPLILRIAELGIELLIILIVFLLNVDKKDLRFLKLKK
jgi:uncharacterized membrane protein YbhN (UPF0104 family)